ncbi:hypothetical protein JOM56_014757 [Amanita muscaria]
MGHSYHKQIATSSRLYSAILSLKATVNSRHHCSYRFPMLPSRLTPLSMRHSIRPHRLDPAAYATRFLNQPGLVDRWLDQAYRQTSTSGLSFVSSGSVPLLDYGPQAVICRIERRVHKSIDDPESVFTESDRYELYLTTMSCTVLGGSPFAFSTSSSILLEGYSGSPDEMCAPSWTGRLHDRLEFVQSQDELSAFLRELGKIGTTQYVMTYVGYDPQQHLDPSHQAIMPARRRKIFSDSSNYDYC